MQTAKWECKCGVFSSSSALRLELGSVFCSVLRSMIQVKVVVSQCKHTPVQVKVMHLNI